MKIRILTNSQGKNINWISYAVRRKKPCSAIKIVDLTYFKRSKQLYSLTIFLSVYDIDTLKELI